MTRLFTLALAFIALVGVASGQPFKSFNASGPTDPARVIYHSNPDVKFAPVDAVGDSGTVLNMTDLVTSPTFTLTVTNALQPTEFRELFFAQSDAAGTSLEVTYTVSVQAWDGSIRPYTFTLTNDGTYALPIPVISLVSLSYAAENEAASDKIMVGWRGFYVPGAVLTATNQLLMESVAGDVPATAGTLATDNRTTFGYAYLPNSISSGDSLALAIRTQDTQSNIFLGSPGLDQTGATQRLGTDP